MELRLGGESSPLVETVMSRYPPERRPDRVERVEGGFSGSQVWKIQSPAGLYALRRWAAGSSSSHILMIHRILDSLRRRGCDFAPQPLPDRFGQTLQRIDSHHWELCDWLEGIPPAEQAISDAALADTMNALGRLHRTLFEILASDPPAELGDAEARAAVRDGREIGTPAIARRRAEWNRLSDLLLRSRPDSLEPEVAALYERTRILAAERREDIGALFRRFARPMRMGVCLRDLHRENLLLVGNRLTGIVDFEAIGIDSPACDLGRLLGSLVPDRPDRYRTAFAAYRSVRPLTDEEIELASAIDRTGTAVSAMRWAEWLAIRPGRFSDSSAAIARWRSLVTRMELQRRTDVLQ